MYYPTLSIVSKTFHSILSFTTELYRVRSHVGNTEQCVYVCLWDEIYQCPQWFTLWINPNKTLTKKRKKKKTTRQLLVPIKSWNFPSLSRSTIVVGSEIYVVGGPGIDYEPSSAVQVLDCRSHTWRDAPSMNVARKSHEACVYDGKIYVLGGVRVEDQPWAEVFDIKTQTWERLPDPDTELRSSRSIYGIAEIQGKIHFQYYLGNPVKKCAYDTKQGKWEESCNGVVTYPYSNCVMDGVCYRTNSNSWSNDCGLRWSTDGNCGDVKGLESLNAKYKTNGGSTHNPIKLVSSGGKLYLIWEGYKNRNPNNRKKIWCAEIAVEKRHGGEFWGNVEWLDFVHTVPMSCKLLHCLVVSV